MDVSWYCDILIYLYLSVLARYNSGSACLSSITTENSLSLCDIAGIDGCLVFCNINSAQNIGLVALIKQSQLYKGGRTLLPCTVNLYMFSTITKCQ